MCNPISDFHSSSLAMDPLFPLALQYIRRVQSQIAGDGYDQFRQTLKQYRHRIIDSSTVISTFQKLFHDHQTLLDAFKPFVPSHRAAAAAAAEEAENPNVRSSVDFINRVGTRFDGGKGYRKFLDCMHAYARAEMTTCEVRDRVLRLFRGNDDLIDEFLCFLPESCCVDGGRSKSKRRIGHGHDHDHGQGHDRGHDRDLKRGMKRRGSDEETPRRAVRRRLDRYGREEAAAAERAVNRHNDMEDLLCDIDVKIENLINCTKSAESLHGGLSKDGGLSPAGVRLDEHFTPLNLACIRGLDRKFLQVAHEDMVHALDELIRVLKNKEEGLKRERVKVVQKWNRIRQAQ